MLNHGAAVDDSAEVTQSLQIVDKRTVNDMVKRAAKAAGINAAVSPRWLQHTHARMRLTTAPACPRSKRHSDTATSRRQATRLRPVSKLVVTCAFPE
jgi:hypothetical protein